MLRPSPAVAPLLLTALTFTFLTACGGAEGPDPDDNMSPGAFDIRDEVDMVADSTMDMGAPAANNTSPGVDMRPGEDMEPAALDMMPPVADMDEPAEPDMSSEEDMSAEPDMSDPNVMYPPVTDAPLGGMRPAEVTLPTGFDNSREVPLIIALHGYGGNKDSVGRYFSLKRNVDARDFILVSPEGKTDTFGSKFWNATPECCDGFKSGVDDAGYLRGVIEEAMTRFRIDRGKIYIAGYSNGGFMAYRMACDSADYVTGIFVLAGGTYKDETLCQPAQPVQILHLHGTSDQTIRYNGGSAYPTAPQHPGALESVETWAAYNGCMPAPVMLDATDVDAVTVETASVTGFQGCPSDGAVELWTLPEAPHNPGLPQTMGDYILDRFFAIDRTP